MLHVAGTWWREYPKVNCWRVSVAALGIIVTDGAHCPWDTGMTVDASGVFNLELSSDEDDEEDTANASGAVDAGDEHKSLGRQRSASMGVEMTSIAVEGDNGDTSVGDEGLVAVRDRSASTGTPSVLVDARKKKKSRRKRVRSRSRSRSRVATGGKLARGRWRAVRKTVQTSQKVLKEERTRVSRQSRGLLLLFSRAALLCRVTRLFHTSALWRVC